VSGWQGEGSTGRLMPAERWQQVLRIMDEAFADYLTGMAALRKRVVGDVKRKLNDGEGLDRSRAEQSSPPERPASAARHRRGRGRRPRG